MALCRLARHVALPSCSQSQQPTAPLHLEAAVHCVASDHFCEAREGPSENGAGASHKIAGQVPLTAILLVLIEQLVKEAEVILGSTEVVIVPIELVQVEDNGGFLIL
ncbi:hypothetical protein U1Q18_052164, partial [Sarracenia purpurea var. burkii]